MDENDPSMNSSREVLVADDTIIVRFNSNENLNQTSDSEDTQGETQVEKDTPIPEDRKQNEPSDESGVPNDNQIPVQEQDQEVKKTGGGAREDSSKKQHDDEIINITSDSSQKQHDGEVILVVNITPDSFETEQKQNIENAFFETVELKEVVQFDLQDDSNIAAKSIPVQPSSNTASSTMITPSQHVHEEPSRKTTPQDKQRLLISKSLRNDCLSMILSLITSK